MKHHGNTLYVTKQGAYLHKRGDTLAIRFEGKDVFTFPLHNLQNIACFGNVSCSPFMMGFCGEESVGLSFHTERGRFLARIQGEQSGNILLRRAQHRITDDALSALPTAQNMILAKISNARGLLLRALRDHAKEIPVAQLTSTAQQLRQSVQSARTAESLDRLRGVEGDAAKLYFSAMNHLILHQKEGFEFIGRNKRPPLDNFNAMLSFGYTLLANDTASACQSVGLDPQMGFLHADRSGRNSLALDLMEELRPFMDRLVLSLINRRQVVSSGFTKRESGAVQMDDATRKVFLVAYQTRKEEILTHPFLQETIPIGLLPHIQSQLLARFLRGDLDAYPPFFWR